MDDRDRRELTALLRRRQDAAETALAALDAQNTLLAQARADATADDEHDPEGVTLSEEWSRAEGMRRELLRERRDLDAALTRSARDDYGVCVDCGRRIPMARLRAKPEATRCVACAQRHER